MVLKKKFKKKKKKKSDFFLDFFKIIIYSLLFIYSDEYQDFLVTRNVVNSSKSFQDANPIAKFRRVG